MFAPYTSNFANTGYGFNQAPASCASSGNSNTSVIYSTNTLTGQPVAIGLITWTGNTNINTPFSNANLGNQIGSGIGSNQTYANFSALSGNGLSTSGIGSNSAPVIFSNTAIPNAITINPLGQVFANGQFAGVVRSI